MFRISPCPDHPKVITSSLDRTVKVWNINNIFEQVHVIDRHELQVDDIRCVLLALGLTIRYAIMGH